MLTIKIKGREEFNNATQEFIQTKDTILTLEHSLVSVSKWEAKYHKPFLGKDKKTYEETIDYIKCMTITQNVDPAVYRLLTKENMDEINEYIVNPMTATWFNEQKKYAKKNSEQITSELIYYWMVALEIPFDPCQKWHLNRLLTLIKVCEKKNEAQSSKANGKHSNKAALASKYASLNAARRKKTGSKG